MNEDKRNVLMLAAFTACLLTMCGVLVVWQLRVPNQAERSAVLSSEVSPEDLPPLDPPKLEGPYRAIADRNLFRSDVKLPAQPGDTKTAPVARRQYGGGGWDGVGGVEWIPPAPVGAWMSPALPGTAPPAARATPKPRA